MTPHSAVDFIDKILQKKIFYIFLLDIKYLT